MARTITFWCIAETLRRQPVLRDFSGIQRFYAEDPKHRNQLVQLYPQLVHQPVELLKTLVNTTTVSALDLFLNLKEGQSLAVVSRKLFGDLYSQSIKLVGQVVLHLQSEYLVVVVPDALADRISEAPRELYTELSRYLLTCSKSQSSHALALELSTARESLVASTNKLRGPLQASYDGPSLSQATQLRTTLATSQQLASQVLEQWKSHHCRRAIPAICPSPRPSRLTQDSFSLSGRLSETYDLIELTALNKTESFYSRVNLWEQHTGELVRQLEFQPQESKTFVVNTPFNSSTQNMVFSYRLTYLALPISNSLDYSLAEVTLQSD